MKEVGQGRDIASHGFKANKEIVRRREDGDGDSGNRQAALFIVTAMQR